MNTATLIKTVRTGFKGTAKLWKLDPPIEERDWSGELEGTHEYVITSAVNAMFSGPETYIFPADEDGNVTSWGELKGSFHGSLDHKRAIEGAGYTVITRLEAENAALRARPTTSEAVREALEWLCFEHQPKMCATCTRSWGDHPPDFATCAAETDCLFGSALATLTAATRPAAPSSEAVQKALDYADSAFRQVCDRLADAEYHNDTARRMAIEVYDQTRHQHGLALDTLAAAANSVPQEVVEANSEVLSLISRIDTEMAPKRGGYVVGRHLLVTAIRDKYATIDRFLRYNGRSKE